MNKRLTRSTFKENLQSIGIIIPKSKETFIYATLGAANVLLITNLCSQLSQNLTFMLTMSNHEAYTLALHLAVIVI